MAKVKMGDIKDSSNNVKSVFRLPMSSRTTKWLNRQTFTNEDLLDILDISENKERHADKRSFYQRLILSQKGPFSSEVFTAFAENLFAVEPMLHLIENSTSTTENARKIWLNYTMVSNIHWFVFNFYSKDKGIQFGIDITKAPYNIIYAEHIVIYSAKTGRGNLIKEYFIELNRILDTMNEDEIFKWYSTTVSTTYADRAVDFIMNYDKMPEKVITAYCEKANISHQNILAMHPNCSPEFRERVFNRTGDEKYLPEAVKDIFLF